MKKRKPPIILITCLVFFGAAAFAFNYATTDSQNPHTPQQQQQQPQAQQPQPNPQVSVGQKRPTVDSKSVVSQVKSQMGGKSADSIKATGFRGPAGIPMKGPSIAMPKASTNKPTPSDSQIEGQWYTPEAHKNGS